MKTIEKPVDMITTGSFKDIAGVITGLLESCKSIYERSSFYKEARIVSFLDHMYQNLLEKMKKEFTIIRIITCHTRFEEVLQNIEF